MGCARRSSPSSETEPRSAVPGHPNAPLTPAGRRTNYLFAPDVDERDLDDVEPATAVMPGSAVDEGVVTQERASQLRTGIAQRVAAASSCR